PRCGLVELVDAQGRRADATTRAAVLWVELDVHTASAALNPSRRARAAAAVAEDTVEVRTGADGAAASAVLRVAQQAHAGPAAAGAATDAAVVRVRLQAHTATRTGG